MFRNKAYFCIIYQQMQLFIVFEHASGYGLFSVREFEEVGAFLPQVEEAVTQAAKFQQVVKLVGYRAFTSAAQALENINAISEGELFVGMLVEVV